MKRISFGFSLIEAIVALVILSVAFVSIWAWFGTSVVATEKMRTAIGLPAVTNEFINRMELIDFAREQSGEMIINGYQVLWHVQEKRRSDNEVYRRQQAWIVVLYTGHAKVKKGEQTVSTIDTQFVRQWRDPAYIDPREIGQ